jgi:hypothetical protein
MLRRLLGFVCAAAVLVTPKSGLADLFDDFSGAQRGSWAPARWWDDYACRGRFVVPAKSSPKFDVAFSRGRRAAEINAAGGFVIEVDVIEIRGDRAVISIGAGDIEKAAVAVVLYADNNSSEDQIYVYGEPRNIGSEFDEGERVRIEVDTDDVSTKGGEAKLTVLFGDTEAVSNHSFQWRKAPLGFHLGAGKGRAVFDNLHIAPASPVIEFEQASSTGGESDAPAGVNVVLKHPLAGERYTVDYKVTGGTAEGGGIDYTIDAGTLTFEPGQEKRPITVDVRNDEIDETDETIELTLSNPQGHNLQLGRTARHTHTILGRWPTVFFRSQSSTGNEDACPARIKVELSHVCSDRVRVDYEVAGGTATRGKDYVLADGTLEFAPGQTAKEINFGIIDDTDSENSINETIVLALSKPENAGLGSTTQHVYEIVDDEPGIEFDGVVWLPMVDKHTRYNGKPVLSVNDAGQLEWVPVYGHLLTAKLPQKRLSKAGDVAEYGWLYKGEGSAQGSYVENILERYGSGDLRIGFFDSNGNPISTDRTYFRSEQTWCGYKGYQARLSPHVPSDMRADKWAKRVNPNGQGCSSLLDWSDTWGYTQYYNGHGAPVGEFSPLIFRLDRTAEDTVEFSVTLNGIKHTYVDTENKDQSEPSKPMETLYGTGKLNVVAVPDTQPKKIDTMAIYFANQRPFELITFAKR